MTDDYYKLLRKTRKELRDACFDLQFSLFMQEKERGVYDYTSVVQTKQQNVDRLMTKYTEM